MVKLRGPNQNEAYIISSKNRYTTFPFKKALKNQNNPPQQAVASETALKQPRLNERPNDLNLGIQTFRKEKMLHKHPTKREVANFKTSMTPTQRQAFKYSRYEDGTPKSGVLAQTETLLQSIMNIYNEKVMEIEKLKLLGLDTTRAERDLNSFINENLILKEYLTRLQMKKDVRNLVKLIAILVKQGKINEAVDLEKQIQKIMQDFPDLSIKDIPDIIDLQSNPKNTPEGIKAVIQYQNDVQEISNAAEVANKHIEDQNRIEELSSREGSTSPQAPNSPVIPQAPPIDLARLNQEAPITANIINELSNIKLSPVGDRVLSDRSKSKPMTPIDEYKEIVALGVNPQSRLAPAGDRVLPDKPKSKPTTPVGELQELSGNDTSGEETPRKLTTADFNDLFNYLGDEKAFAAYEPTNENVFTINGEGKVKNSKEFKNPWAFRSLLDFVNLGKNLTTNIITLRTMKKNAQSYTPQSGINYNNELMLKNEVIRILNETIKRKP